MIVFRDVEFDQCIDAMGVRACGLWDTVFRIGFLLNRCLCVQRLHPAEAVGGYSHHDIGEEVECRRLGSLPHFKYVKICQYSKEE